MGGSIQLVCFFRNGTVDLNEFLDMMVAREKESERSSSETEDVSHTFRIFDRDGDGLITRQELRYCQDSIFLF